MPIIINIIIKGDLAKICTCPWHSLIAARLACSVISGQPSPHHPKLKRGSGSTNLSPACPHSPSWSWMAEVISAPCLPSDCARPRPLNGEDEIGAEQAPEDWLRASNAMMLFLANDGYILIIPAITVFRRDSLGNKTPTTCWRTQIRAAAEHTYLQEVGPVLEEFPIT